jgi:hypothetical protein
MLFLCLLRQSTAGNLGVTKYQQAKEYDTLQQDWAQIPRASHESFDLFPEIPNELYVVPAHKNTPGGV